MFKKNEMVFQKSGNIEMQVQMERGRLLYPLTFTVRLKKCSPMLQRSMQ